MRADPSPALRLGSVGLTRDGRDLLDDVDLTVGGDERWVVLGANGSGKTSLLRIAGLVLHPSRGRVEVLGHRLGEVDVRWLRTRIGLASAAVADSLRPTLTALDVVITARHAALEPWWHHYDDEDRRAAQRALARLDAADLEQRTFGSLSSGERQRVLVARSLFADVGLLLLDEPTAGLDLASRERLVTRMGELAADPTTPPMLLVTHHLEEIPNGMTHALVVRAGRVVTAAPLGEALTDATLSEAFDLRLEVAHRSGRWSAVAR